MSARGVTAAALALASCATVAPGAGYDHVARLVTERTGHKTGWENGPPADADVARRVDELLGRDLTEPAAIELALLNNPALQATYEELGVAQADLVQAGLLKNPSLDVGVRFPESAGMLNVELALVQDFLDLFTLPLRKSLAAGQFEAAKLRLANEVFHVVGRVRRELYSLEAIQQIVELRRTVLDAAALSAELARRQHEAGNIGDLELETQRGVYEESKLDLTRDELRLEQEREAVTRLLGLWGARTDWTLPAKLAELPEAEAPLEHLEKLALTRRLDVATLRAEAELAAEALDVAKTSRFVGALDVGVSHSSGPEAGIRVTGPTVRLELPIFDQRQGLLLRLEAQARQSEKRLAASAVDARSEVRAARLTLLAQRQVAQHYKNVLIPSRERTVALAQQRYNGMLLGVFQLLQAKQAEIESYWQYIEAVRDYWTARVELEGAVGGSLPEAKSEVTP